LIARRNNCHHVVSTRVAGCDRSLSRVSKGARANNCHRPRLALIRHWFVCVYYVTHFTAIQVANRIDCRIASPIIDRQRLRPCRALQKSPLFVRWRHSGIFRTSGCMIKFYTAYCSSSHHENILCNFGTNLHFCVIFNCCEARAVNCTRAIEHRNEIAKCFLTVGIWGKIFRLCHC